jgi:hypothetical protein
MNMQPGPNRRKKRGLIAALAALVLIALALVAAALVWALDRPQGLQVSRSSIHFGYQEVGRPSAAQTVTLTNYGGQDTIRVIRIEGENSGDFTVTNASSCVHGPFPTNASCTLVVRFTPAEQGDRAAILFVSGFAGGPGVFLYGTGTTP